MQPTTRRMDHNLLVIIFQGNRRGEDEDESFAKVLIIGTRCIHLRLQTFCQLVIREDLIASKDLITGHDDEFD